MDEILCMNGMNLNLCILCMFEDTFLLCMDKILHRLQCNWIFTVKFTCTVKLQFGEHL